jgi:hypothetical protein
VRDDSIGTLWLLYRDDKSAEGAVIRGLIRKLLVERNANIDDWGRTIDEFGIPRDRMAFFDEFAPEVL